MAIRMKTEPHYEHGNGHRKNRKTSKTLLKPN